MRRRHFNPILIAERDNFHVASALLESSISAVAILANSGQEVPEAT